MKKIILLILGCAILQHASAQVITPTGIGMGVRRTNQTNNWNFVLTPTQLNPGTFTLPNQVVSVNRIIYNFTFTPPASYPNSFTNQIIHKLKIRNGSTTTVLGIQPVSPAFAQQGNTSIDCTVDFGNIEIITYAVGGTPISPPWTFFIESYSTDGFGHDVFISATPDYKFTRALWLDEIKYHDISSNQTVDYFPYQPAPIGTLPTGPLYYPASSDGGTLTFQWEKSEGNDHTWSVILGATSVVFTPPLLYKNTWYRRKATSVYGITAYSNTISIYYPDCPNDKYLLADQQNTICGMQSFYNLKDGDEIYPSKILGSVITPNIATREFGYEYSRSTDGGAHWEVVQPKQLIDLGSDFLGGIFINNTDFNHDPLNYIIEPFKFDIQKGPVQTILYRREYFHWYDTWGCGPLGAFPCTADWHSQGFSNVVAITLTTKPLKPVGNIIQTLGTNQANCNWSDQTKGLQIPLVNNGEYYRWEVPSYYTPYSPLQGSYANTMQFSTNANPQQNFVQGGEICVTVTQVGHVDRRCFTIKGTAPFSASLPANIAACEGENVILKPVLIKGSQTVSPVDYTFSWNAYNSPSTVTCNNPIGGSLLNSNCSEFKVVVQNAQQYKKQEIDLVVQNPYGCQDTAKTVITTTPGWQIGILHAYDDPKAKQNADLAFDAAKNYLYFTSDAGIYRAYFDNGPDKVWKYLLLKDKNNNLPILGDGPLQYYKGSTDKLYFIYNGRLLYAESTDQGQTWISYDISNSVSDISLRIKIYNNNLYYVRTSDRCVYYKPLSNLAGPETRVGSVRMNYSQNMFTVEDGILAYADEANNLYLFDALTGAALNINLLPAQKLVDWNSSISIYNGNIYFVSGQTIRIIKKDINGIYSSSENVLNGTINQLAGTFTINKQTGTIYAKSYSPEARQIYYLNNTWTSNPIRQYISGGAVNGNSMIYGNGHVYFINAGNILGNAFYVSPCVPSVLRTAGDIADPLNDPLPNTLPEIRQLSLAPNPTQDLVNISFAVPKATQAQLRIISVTGNGNILKEESIEAGSFEWKVDLQTYSAGVYIIELITDGSVYAHAKLIKQ
ncbi:MAG: T9SS type A sorting domain-containing protein [Cytophaga sp.]|uniref:T9SS type A sorting domain-containing protein n=1 Tax=Cytophaga sp. TaxID=29535 RepID=UPI003F822BCA